MSRLLPLSHSSLPLAALSITARPSKAEGRIILWHPLLLAHVAAIQRLPWSVFQVVKLPLIEIGSLKIPSTITPPSEIVETHAHNERLTAFFTIDTFISSVLSAIAPEKEGPEAS